MPDEKLIVGGEFDPGGIVRGVDIGKASLEDFRKIVAKLALQLPDVDISKIAQAGAAHLRKQAQEAEALRQRIESIVALAKTPPVPGGGVGPGVIITRDKVKEIEFFSQTLVQVKQRSEEVTRAVHPMAAAMATSSADARRAAEAQALFAKAVGTTNVAVHPMAAAMGAASKAVHPMAAAMSSSAQSAVALSGGFNLARVGGSRLINTLASIVVHSAGVEGKLATVASNLLVFGIGGAAVAGAAVAVIALTGAWNVFTAAARKAKKENDDLIKSIDERLKRESSTGPQADAARAAKAYNDILRERKRLLEDIDLLGMLGPLLAPGGGRAPGIQQFVQQREAQAQIRQQLLAAEAAGKVYEAGIDAARAGIEAAREWDRAARTARASLAAFEAQVGALGPQTFGAQPGFVSREEEAAVRRRIELEERATREEVQRMRELQSVERQRFADATDPTAIAAQQRSIDELEARIRLRRLEGAETVRQIRRELDLLEATRRVAREAQDHLERVARARGGNLVQGEGRAPPALPPLPAILQGARASGLVSGEAQAIRDAERATDSLRQAWDEVQDSVIASAAAVLGLGRNVTRVVTDALNMGNAFSALDKANSDLAKAATEADKLAANLAKVQATGDVISSIIGGVGAMGSILSGALSSRAAIEAEHDRILRENNVRLSELRRSMDVRFEGAGALREAGAISDASLIARETHSHDALVAALDASGLTLVEWAQMVEDLTGLEILDSEGHVLGSTFEQANAALKELVRSITNFGDSVNEQARVISARNRIFGIQGGELQANREVLLGGLNLDDELEERIRGLDLNTAEGRAAYQEFLKQLYRLAAAGAITAEELGRFEDVGQVVDVAAEGAEIARQKQQEAADKLREAAERTAAALQALKDAAQAAFPSLIDMRTQLLGITDPTDLFRQSIIKLAATGSAQLAGMFSGFDLSDSASRDALRKKLLSVIDTMLSGTAGLQALGLTPEQVAPFLEFLQEATASLDSLSTVADRLADVEARRTLRARLAGDSELDATEQFRISLRSLQEIAPEFARQFAGMDLGDAEIRDELRQRLVALFDRGVTPEELSEADWLAFLNDSADFLNSFNESVQEATRSMTNMPRAINLAALEFEAQAASPMSWSDIWRTGPTRQGTSVGSITAAPVEPLRDQAIVDSLSTTDATIRRLTDALQSGSLAMNLERFVAVLASLVEGDPTVTARRLEAALDSISLARTGQSADAWIGR